MAATAYTYSLTTDFPNDAMNSGRLAQEIDDSAIASANYDRVDTDGDVVKVWFDNPLSVGDEAILDGIVAAHAGTALSGLTPPPYLGQNFQQVNEDGQSSTTSSAWQDKAVLTTPSHFAAGTYMVQFYAECKCSLTNNLCAVCCRHIDAQHDEYLGAADLDVGHDPSDVEVPFGGFKIISLTGGAHTFKIQFAQSKGSGTVYIRKARIALWRLS